MFAPPFNPFNKIDQIFWSQKPAQETRKSDLLWIRNKIASVLAFAMGRMKIMQYLYLVAKNPIKALLFACSSL